MSGFYRYTRDGYDQFDTANYLTDRRLLAGKGRPSTARSASLLVAYSISLSGQALL